MGRGAFPDEEFEGTAYSEWHRGGVVDTLEQCSLAFVIPGCSIRTAVLEPGNRGLNPFCRGATSKTCSNSSARYFTATALDSYFGEIMACAVHVSAADSLEKFQWAAGVG